MSDRTLFWTAADLEMKLLDFQHYYNDARTERCRGLCPRACQFVSMAAALSRTVSDADGGVLRLRPMCPGNLQTSCVLERHRVLHVLSDTDN